MLEVICTNRSKLMCFLSHGSNTPLMECSHKRAKAARPNKGKTFNDKTSISAFHGNVLILTSKGYTKASQAKTMIQYLVIILFTPHTKRVYYKASELMENVNTFTILNQRASADNMQSILYQDFSILIII